MKWWFPKFHHYYLGLMLLIVSFIILATGHNTIAIILFLIGEIAVLDDFYQHFRQNHEPNYHSPLHRLYELIYSKCEWIHKLNKFFNRMFGGRN